MFDLSEDLRSLPSRAQALAERSDRELDAPPSPDVQPPWRLPELLVLTAAVSGRVSREENETTPHAYQQGFEEFIDSALDVLDAGVCGVHIDFGGITAIEQSGLLVTEMYDKTVGAIRAATSNDWISDCNILRGQSFYENVYPIVTGLADVVPMAPNFPVDWMESAASVAVEHDVGLLFSIHSAAEVDLANRYIYSRGLTSRPARWGILIGYQYDDATDRLATYLAHPQAMITELVQIVERIREVDPDGFISVCAAGRAGHYLATAAILLGLHVRVGTEDTMWRYPHKDEIVVDSREMVERVRVTAEALGRTLATPEQARLIMGLPARSPRADEERSR